MAETPKPTFIDGNVSGTRRFTGDVIINGNIEADARIVVTEGSLTVSGNVGDSAFIAQTSASKDKGVEVRGNLADDAKIDASGSVTVRDTGNASIIRSSGDIHAETAGAHATLVAQGDVTVKGAVAKDAAIQAERDIRTGNIGKDASLEAGRDIKAGNVEKGASLDAGRNIEAGHVDKDASLQAGGKIKTAQTEPSQANTKFASLDLSDAVKGLPDMKAHQGGGATPQLSLPVAPKDKAAIALG